MKNPKTVAIQSAKSAGKMMLRKFTTLSQKNIIVKSKHEIVTPVDLASEKIILRDIKKNFPDHSILSEEAGNINKNKSPYLWIVDPLDGTTNFAMGNPLFSISIALFKNGDPILGIIHVPFLDQTFVAEKNKPAKLNNKPISASKKKDISSSFLTFCHGSDEKSIKRAINIYRHLKFEARDLRQVGSAAIELAWVAMGKTEAIIIPGVHSWDVASGVLLVRQAGGKVTDMNGKNWDLNSHGIIASNKNINSKLISRIQKIR